MSNSKHPKKKVSDIVRKLLDVGDMSIKEAAQYLNYTEQSFRNKLSRDSFSLRDLFILCDVCGASPMIEYSSADPEYDCPDRIIPSDYLSDADFKRIKEIQKNNINKNISAVIELLEKELPEEEINKLTAEDIVNVMVDISRERIRKRNNRNSNSDKPNP